jgi:hypothetical protein
MTSYSRYCIIFADTLRLSLPPPRLYLANSSCSAERKIKRVGDTPVAKRWQHVLSCLEISPRLRPYIHTLAIEGPCDPLVLRAPADLGRLFPCVVTLELSGVIPLLLVLALPTLEQLVYKVNECRIQVPGQGDPDVVNEEARSPAPKLRTLEVSGRFSIVSQPLLTRWIESTGVANDLESALLICHCYSHSCLMAFLHMRSSYFRRLELRIQGYGGPGENSAMLVFMPVCAKKTSILI